MSGLVQPMRITTETSLTKVQLERKRPNTDTFTLFRPIRFDFSLLQRNCKIKQSSEGSWWACDHLGKMKMPSPLSHDFTDPTLRFLPSICNASSIRTHHAQKTRCCLNRWKRYFVNLRHSKGKLKPQGNMNCAVSLTAETTA